MSFHLMQKWRAVVVSLIIITAGAAAAYGLWHASEHPAFTVPDDSMQNHQATPATAPSSSIAGQSDTKQQIVDSSTWQLLSNQYGWSLKYPGSWDAQGHEDTTAQTDVQPYIEGPRNCYLQNQECGYLSVGIWLGSLFPNAATRKLRNLNAKDFLLTSEFPTPPDPNKILLSRGNTTIDRAPAYYIVYRQTNFEGYPSGIVMKQIAVKYKEQFYTITYYETGSNKAFISGLNSPNRWHLNSIFDQIIASIRFSP